MIRTAVCHFVQSDDDNVNAVALTLLTLPQDQTIKLSSEVRLRGSGVETPLPRHPHKRPNKFRFHIEHGLDLGKIAEKIFFLGTYLGMGFDFW